MSINKPERPADDDCCGGGCSPCVWDHYNEQLILWREQQGNRTETTPSSDENEPIYR